MVITISIPKETFWHKSRILWLAMFMSVTTLWSQDNLDSLRQLYEAAEGDSLKYERVRKYEQATRKVDRVAALPLMKERVRYAQRVGNDDWLMKSYSTLGNNYMYLSKNDSAEIYLNLGVDLAEKLDDNRFFNLGLNNLASLYQGTNDYEKAIESYHRVILIADSLGDYTNLIATNINLGLLLIEQEDFERAIPYLQKVEHVYDLIEDDDPMKKECEVFLTSAYLNLGNCFFKLGNTVEAKKKFNYASNYLTYIEDEYSLIYFNSYIDLSIGILRLDDCQSTNSCSKKLYNELLILADSAIVGFQNIEYDIGLCESQLFKGRLLAHLGEYDHAKDVTQKGLIAAQNLSLIHAQESAYQNLAFIEQNLGNLENYVEYIALERAIEDSIINSERDRVWQNLEKKFETAQKENEILNLKLESEQKTKRQNRIIFLSILSLLSTIGIAYFIYSRYKLKKERELAQFEREVNIAMSRFVPMSFIRAIGREEIMDVQLGDKVQKNVTVLFTDIRGFTSISEGMSPDENFNFVQEYASVMGPIIEANAGFINQYLGDGIMAIFEDSSTDALKACIEMQAALVDFEAGLVAGNGQPIKVGMGMHTGPLILGIIGDQVRRDATIISDTVNSAARIESTSKMYEQNILMSDASYERLEESYRSKCVLLGDVEVKGKSDLIKVYAYE